jgi:hypothetical protein
MSDKRVPKVLVVTGKVTSRGWKPDGTPEIWAEVSNLMPGVSEFLALPKTETGWGPFEEWMGTLAADQGDLEELRGAIAKLFEAGE